MLVGFKGIMSEKKEGTSKVQVESTEFLQKVRARLV